jgi:hypothetical protein
MSFELDRWLSDPAVRITHEGKSAVDPDRLWAATREVRIGDTGMLGRLIRWRIPGTTADLEFDRLFREPPFIALEERDDGLLSGIVGRIWTLRRDYPRLGNPEQFREWSERGTARVLFATWTESLDPHGAALRSEVRLDAFGGQGKLGLAAVRPLISGFHHLVGTEGIGAAVRAAEVPPERSGSGRDRSGSRRLA